MGKPRKNEGRGCRFKKDQITPFVDALAYGLSLGLVYLPRNLNHYRRCILAGFGGDISQIEQVLKRVKQWDKITVATAADSDMSAKWKNGMKENYSSMLFVLKMYYQLLVQYWEVNKNVAEPLSAIIAKQARWTVYPEVSKFGTKCGEYNLGNLE